MKKTLTARKPPACVVASDHEIARGLCATSAPLASTKNSDSCTRDCGGLHQMRYGGVDLCRVDLAAVQRRSKQYSTVRNCATTASTLTTANATVGT